MHIIKLSFPHGLGDTCHFLTILKLYEKRGYRFAIRYDLWLDKLFRLAGIPFATSVTTWHPFNHPWQFNKVSQTAVCCYNKIAGNIPSRPLPWLDNSVQDLWEELRQPPPFTLQPEERFINEARAVLSPLPRPWILLHGKGKSLPEQKNIPDALYNQLKSNPHVYCLDGARRSFEALEGLLCVADGLIGIDSGVLALARFCGIKVVGLFFDLHPCAVCLPNPNATFFTPVSACNKNLPSYWNLQEYSELSAEQIMDRWKIE
jgi:hypothetical protein